MSLIKKLQECSTIGQADPILTRLGAGPAVKKLVETALILSNSQDPQQRNHAYSFMESAIKELEDGEHDAGAKVHEEDSMGKHADEDELNNHKLHEEELDNHNTGSRDEGSEQSSDNTEPYEGEGKDTTNGEKPMQDMDGATNQWNETGGFPPNGMPPNGGGMPQPGGMPPNGGGMPQPGMMPGMSPGLSPDVAQEMGMVMPQLPPMDTNQMMRQMQYTLESYHKRVVVPLVSHIKTQRAAIKEQSNQIKELRTNSGSMTLDLDSLKKNAPAKFRETEPTETPNYGTQVLSLQPHLTRRKDKLDTARSEITEMDKIIRSGSSSIYN